MKIEILGMGCTKCELLAAAVRRAADELGAPYELTHVKDLGQIAAYGVMMTPALAIDGRVQLVGKVPGAAELKALLQQAQSQ